MTDKIIIDGIDVSECRNNFISVTNDICCYAESERTTMIKKCSECPNCIFKQLKRKEQVLNEVEKYCEEQDLKYDTTACDILNIIDKTEVQ